MKFKGYSNFSCSQFSYRRNTWQEIYRPTYAN